jgi:ribosome biogenesis ATPase
LFTAAVEAAPSIVFIDEVDVVAGCRDRATKEMERRVVTQLVGCLDTLPPNVYVIAATTFPDLLDPAMRRCGRFDREIAIGVPNDQ